MNSPTLDLWVCASIFMSGCGKQNPLGDDKLISDVVGKRDTTPNPPEPIRALRNPIDVRRAHLLVRRAC